VALAIAAGSWLAISAAQPRPSPPPAAPADPNATASAQAVVDTAKETLSTNEAVARIRERAEAIRALANRCTGAKCPIVHDCATAARLLQALADAEAFLDAELAALNRAAADTAAAHESVVAQTRITSTNLAIAQEALAVKEYLYRLAVMLFDLASLADDVNNMVKDGTPFTGERLEKLDKLYETLKDAEGLANDVVTAANDVADQALGTNTEAPNPQVMSGATAGAIGVSNETMGKINDIKSNLSDAASAVDDLRKQLRGPNPVTPGSVAGGVAGAIGKIAFRDMKLLVEKQMRELQAQIDELTKNLSAEEQVLAGLFEQRMRIGDQRNRVEDALGGVRLARAALEACLARACGLPTLTRPAIPDYYATPAGVQTGERRGMIGWGRALKDLDARLKDAAAALEGAFTIEDRCPAGDETYVTPGPDEQPGAVPPRNVVETNCPSCADIARQLARVLDERDYVRARIDEIERNIARARPLRDKLDIVRRELADQDRYIRRLREIIAQAQIGGRSAGFNVAGEAQQDLALAEARRVEIMGRIRYLEREIARLQQGGAGLDGMKARLRYLESERRSLREALNECERTACRVVVERVVNVFGNNPFDPRDPLGPTGTTTPPPPPTGCTAPQPPSESQTLPCPSGQSGSIVQTRTYVCSGGDWLPGPFVTTSSTCSGGPVQCTGPKPPDETQTLPCPAGQTGAITQSRTFSCVNGTYVAGPFTTVSNTCATPQPTGCATNFTSGSYNCSGSCGIGSAGLTVTSGSNSMTANPFGSNSNAGFTCQGGAATSQSNNLNILGAPGHNCQLNAITLNAFGITCRNNSGGTCTSSCSR
jgi:hypothetical protein